MPAGLTRSIYIMVQISFENLKVGENAKLWMTEEAIGGVL